MRIFVDTNILLDVLTKREQFSKYTTKDHNSPLAPSLLRKEGNPHPSELPLFFPKRVGWGVSEAKSIIFCRVLRTIL